jgi:hypothetical protein
MQTQVQRTMSRCFGATVNCPCAQAVVAPARSRLDSSNGELAQSMLQCSDMADMTSAGLGDLL